MSYFDSEKQTEIQTDASPVGLGAILIQRGNNNEEHIVAYASRSLTDVEQRYSQTEREALAVVWSCEHFHIYIHGKPVTIHTDHKPLVALYNNPGCKPPARIERWALRLQRMRQPSSTDLVTTTRPTTFRDIQLRQVADRAVKNKSPKSMSTISWVMQYRKL